MYVCVFSTYQSKKKFNRMGASCQGKDWKLAGYVEVH